MIEEYLIDCNIEQLQNLIGVNQKHLKLIGDYFKINIEHRANQLLIETKDPFILTQLKETIEILLQLIRKGQVIDEQQVNYTLKLVTDKHQENVLHLYEHSFAKKQNGTAIYPKTLGQKQYLEALKKYDIIFGIGPAGTGKTYLAVVYAVNAMKQGEVERIILTRPAVEAGESLGFLPGDLKEKVDPYLRPLYDALHDMLGAEQTERLIEKKVIEIAPLAYMRGRTLDKSFVILDEAQNSTDSQMKMFLTRLGFGSKMVITGDVTQIDLPRGKNSGLKTAYNILNNVKGIEFIELTDADVVRNPIVARIIKAYNKFEENN